MMRSRLLVVALSFTLACFAQAPKKGKSVSNAHPGHGPQPYGKLGDGKPVEMYTLQNAKGMRADIITYGGAVVRLITPDRNGKPGDVVLGMDSLEGYVAQKSYFGALIGRYGNRIGHAKFTLDGK